MKEKGKAVETHTDINYSSSDLPCQKHPSSSSVGICAYCLKERLIKLVCSDCGEQRLSSCSCSEASSYRNSSATDVGSVGRVSFLIENERIEAKQSQSKPKNGGLGADEVVLLKRSGSSCVGVRRSGVWRIVRLFRRKREKGCERSEEKSEMWVFDYMGAVSRSRSLCSFRGGFFEESSDFAVSSSKISDATERPSAFSEAETRKGVFPVKESDFGGMDESGFIDLKLDLETEAKTDCSVSDMGSLRGGNFGGSCRITVDGRGIKREKRGTKSWRRIFRNYPNWRSASKKDENCAVRNLILMK
ncbi:Protein FAM178B like [Actinidia chinensis var. chinensis]|uniref:Protein FAM178B like n=1 Tax=Actinidia chinensis var. chinensis TaxID=1590841 RepID=A0A2R6PHW2_ACTCC|nr:Protein FAM178B like [Actinidia chinensis var. chinensis]